MFIFTKDIETRNFKALAGMPVPTKYTSLSSRRSIAEQYGKDIIKEITHRNFEDFRNLIGGTDSEKVTQLSALCSEQGKKIDALEKENASLKAKQKEQRRNSEQLSRE